MLYIAVRACDRTADAGSFLVQSRSDLLEVLKHGVDHLEGLINLLTDFGTSQDNLATHEDQEHNLRLDHTVDKTREQLRLVGTEVVMARCKTFQTDWELDVARTDNVLDLEIGELCVEAKLLNDTCILARRKLRVIFRLSTSNDHLARCEDQGCSLGFTDTHDDGRETLERLART
jgi:hypothetical protein